MALLLDSYSNNMCACPICMGERIEQADGVPLGVLPNRGGGVVTPNGKISKTTQEAGAFITRSGASWNGPGVTNTPTVVTYAYASEAPSTYNPGVSGFVPFTAQQIAITELALQSWADVANIVFQRSGSGYADDAAIQFHGYTSGASGAAAFAYLPSGTAATNRAVGSFRGDVWSNVSLPYNANPELLNYGFLTITHEIGHAIGLSHPGDYNAGSGGPITYQNSAEYYEDTLQYSVMSYFDDGFTGANHGSTPGLPNSNFPAAPLMDDISAAQRLYGANMSTRTGNDTYGFGNTTGRPWYAPAGANNAMIFAVWDAGGIDTFNFSGYTQNQVIDLRATSFSNVGGLVGNVSIAAGVTIENAIGGTGADLITGNDANNNLDGGAGADTLIGGAGDDFLFGNNGADSIEGGAGTDTVGYGEPASFLYVEQIAGGAWRVWQDLIFDTVTGVEQARAGGVTYANYQAFADASFNGFFYLASNTDLIAPLSGDPFNGYRHWVQNGRAEGRPTRSFDSLTYLASNADLARIFGADANAGARHFVQSGFAEGRPTTGFDGLLYLASNADLARIFGFDAQSGLIHYLVNGADEGRATTGFDSLTYLASNVDLARIYGPDVAAGIYHYLQFGADEGRATGGFIAQDYAAAHVDLAKIFGQDGFSARDHYLRFGADEGRAAGGFDTVAYWLENGGFGGTRNNGVQSRDHWLEVGADSGSIGDARFGREQANHRFSGETANGVFESGSDWDWYSGTLSAGTHQVILSGGATVRVYNSAGAVVAIYGDGSSIFTASAAGTYYFAVSRPAVSTAGAGSYSLIVGGAAAPEAPEAAPAQSYDDAVGGAMPDFEIGAYDIGVSMDDGWLIG